MELIGSAEASSAGARHLLGRLCAEDGGHEVVPAFEKWAPSWPLQMPALLDAAKTDAIRRRVPSPNRDRDAARNRRHARGARRRSAAGARDRGPPLERHLVDRRARVSRAAEDAGAPASSSAATGPSTSRCGIIRCKPSNNASGSACATAQRAPTLDVAASADTDTYLARLARGEADRPQTGVTRSARTDESSFMTATVRRPARTAYSRRARGSLARCRSVSLEGDRSRRVTSAARPATARSAGAARERRCSTPRARSASSSPSRLVAAASGLTQEEVEQHLRQPPRGAGISSSPTGVAIWPDRTVSGSYEFQHSTCREGSRPRAQRHGSACSPPPRGRSASRLVTPVPPPRSRRLPRSISPPATTNGRCATISRPRRRRKRLVRFGSAKSSCTSRPHSQSIAARLPETVETLTADRVVDISISAAACLTRSRLSVPTMPVAASRIAGASRLADLASRGAAWLRASAPTGARLLSQRSACAGDQPATRARSPRIFSRRRHGSRSRFFTFVGHQRRSGRRRSESRRLHGRFGLPYSERAHASMATGASVAAPV